MKSLDDLYQEIILDHFKHPRNAGPLPEGMPFAEGINPNCGDVVKVAASLEGDQIESIQYHAKGCAVSIASASIMSVHLVSHSLAAAEEGIQQFIACLKEERADTYSEDDPMAALLTVRKFPMRIKCATLPWTALRDLLRM